MTIFTQNGNVVTALAPDADAFAGAKSTDWISIEKFESMMFSIQRGAGATGTTVVTMLNASTASGTGAAAIAFRSNEVVDVTASDVPNAIVERAVAGFTIAAGADKLVNCFVDGEDLDEDKPFVKLLMTEGVDSPVDGAVLAVLTGPRYATDLPESAIA